MVYVYLYFSLFWTFFAISRPLQIYVFIVTHYAMQRHNLHFLFCTFADIMYNVYAYKMYNVYAYKMYNVL